MALVTVGKVEEGETTFNWKIEKFSSLDNRVDSSHKSPSFYFYGQTWYLALYCIGPQNQSDGYISVKLFRLPLSSTIKIQYSVGIRTAKGMMEVWETGTDTSDYNSIILDKSIHRSELLRRTNELLPQDILTVSVMLKKETSETDFKKASVTGTVESKVTGVPIQKAVEDSVACVGKGEPLAKTGSIAFGTKRNVFGQPTFGASTSNTGGLFGNTSQPTGFSETLISGALLGITSPSTQSSGGLFKRTPRQSRCSGTGATSTGCGLFGQSTSAGTGLLGLSGLKINASVQATAERNVADVSIQTTIEDSIADNGKGELLEKTGVEKIVEDVGKLWPNGEHTDVLLKVRDMEFRAHRTILAARTPVLGAMFQHDTTEKASGEVSIDDCEPQVFEQFLYYIYKGAPRELTAKNAYALYVVADKYLVSEVKSLCVRCMRDSLCLDTFCDTLTLSLMHREDELLRKATDFLSRNMIDVMKSVQWQRFVHDHMTWANEIQIRAIELIETRYENEKRALLDQSTL